MTHARIAPIAHGPAPLLVTIPEAKRMLGLARSAIYLRIASGDLDARKAGKRTLLTVASIEKFAAGLPPAPIRRNAA